MSAQRENYPRFGQTTLALSTILALLGSSDVITIPAFPGLEQLLLKMRIAGTELTRGLSESVQIGKNLFSKLIVKTIEGVAV